MSKKYPRSHRESSINNLSAIVSEHKEQAQNYMTIISKVSRPNIAYFVDAYFEKNAMEPLWAVAIFNDIAAKHNLDKVDTFKEIIELAKTTELYKQENPEHEGFRDPKIPVYFLRFIQDFWSAAIKSLRAEWNPDLVELCMMVIAHKENNAYQRGWVNNILRFFYDKPLSDDIKDSLVEAQQLIDDGESFVFHRNFHKLITISVSEYRTRMLIGRIEHYAELNAVKNLYADSKKSAEKKLSSKRRSSAYKNNDDINIVFTKIEIEALLSENQEAFIKKLKTFKN